MSRSQTQAFDLSITDDHANTDQWSRNPDARWLVSLPRSVPIDHESARWLTVLEGLRARVVEGALPGPQLAKLLSVWGRASDRQPSLRRPAIGISEGGQLQASWSFVDLDGRIFTLEIDPEGLVEWFYRDSTTAIARGSEQPVIFLPDEALELLSSGFVVNQRRP